MSDRPSSEGGKPLRVLLIANYANSRQESMLRFTDLMARALTRAGLEVQVAAPAAVLGRLAPAAEGVGKWLGYVDRLLLFPPVMRRRAAWANVVHICDQGNAFYAAYAAGRPVVVTCHDVLAIRSALGEVPQNPTRGTGRILQSMIRRGLERATHVVCVSRATQADLLRITAVPEERASVGYNALNYAHRPMNTDEAERRLCALGLDPGRPYLLHVGGNQWYKNRLGVLRIFDRLVRSGRQADLALALAGKPFTPEMRAFVTDNRLQDRVSDLGAVYEEDLRALYSRARALLFPSLAEGFGWPVIEAQACGCPVFASDRAPLTEIGGAGAVYIDPEDPASAAASVEDHIHDLEAVRERGFANARGFTESAMTARYVAAYRAALATHRGSEAQA